MIQAGYVAPELAGRANHLVELILIDLMSEFDQSMTGEEDIVDYYGLHLAKEIIKEKFGVE
jgi:hypothetical protein